MFGFFKNTPEKQLISILKKELEQEATSSIKQAQGVEMLAAMMLEHSVSILYKTLINSAPSLALKYNIPENEVVVIIKNTTNEVRKKYLANITLIE